jgi:hypothetical protein
MNLYLTPPITPEAREALEIITRSGVTLVHADKLYDLFKTLNARDNSVVIVTLDTDNLLVLVRHITMLLDDIPSYISGIPGVQYPVEWMQIAATLYPVDWLEMEGKLAKSGLLSQKTDQVSTRSKVESISERFSMDKEKPSTPTREEKFSEDDV